MKKIVTLGLAVVLVATMFLFAACPSPEPPPEEPLKVTDCFREIYQAFRFKILYANTAHPKVEQQPYKFEEDYGSLDALLSSEGVMLSKQYSKFCIFTSEKASCISVGKISFEIVAKTDCRVQFELCFAENDVHYSEGTAIIGGVPTTIMFDNLHKSWSQDDAGNNSIKEIEGHPFISGKIGSYFTISLVNQLDFNENSYLIRNLQIGFTELSV